MSSNDNGLFSRLMNNTYLAEFIKYLLQLKNAREMEEFLRAILTVRELEEMPRRLQIVKLLKKGVPQREIASQLGVGTATVTRGSAVMKEKAFQRL